jgi:hypothetical protein
LRIGELDARGDRGAAIARPEPGAEDVRLRVLLVEDTWIART